MIAAAFPIAALRAEGHVQDRAAPAIRCGPKSMALWGAPYDAPQAGRPAAPAGVRRQPGRARHERDRARRAHAACRMICKTRLSVVQQCRPEDLETVRAIYANAEMKAELAAVLHRSAARAWRRRIW